MKRSILLKTFFSYLFISVTLSTLVFFITMRIVKTEYQRQAIKNLSHLGVALQEDIQSLITRDDRVELDRWVKAMGREIDIRITVIAPDGSILADSAADPAQMENHGDRPEIRQALSGKTAESSHISFTFREKMFYHAIPIRNEGKVVGILRLSVFGTMIERVVNEVKNKTVMLMAIILCLALFVALLFSRNLTRPIRMLTYAAGRVAGGDYETVASVRGRDELRLLADSFNTMVRKQKELFHSLEHNKIDLQTIIATIRDPLLVIDEKGRITLLNPGFKTLCSQEDCLGRLYWEILRDSRFHELVKRSQEGEDDLQGELELADRVYLTRVVHMPVSNRLVITFHDINEFKRVEKIKRDFISNLSHELRTPLTAIKGFVETLLEEKPSGNPEYLGIIQRHTDRLVNLVKDLLTLSEMEEPRMRLEKIDVDLCQLARNVLKIFLEKCKGKGICLDVTAQEGLPLFFADPFKLEQLFINLVDNAVKYTDKGEVRVGLTQKENWMEIRVSDTGIGIEDGHLPRIFERFYVADKSRSRDQGGTGLGLAIVKHIVLLHDGRIEVESRPGQGSQFIVTLPILSK